MKLITWLVTLAALAYGCHYLYQQGYFNSFLSSVDNTVQRTSDFATDKAVKEANFQITYLLYQYFLAQKKIEAKKLLYYSK